LVSRIVRNCSGVNASPTPDISMPALLTITSRRPCSDSTWSTAARQPVSDRTSSSSGSSATPCVVAKLRAVAARSAERDATLRIPA